MTDTQLLGVVCLGVKEIGMKHSYFAVVNEAGKYFAGVSALSFQPIWVSSQETDDLVDMGALRTRRHPAWLALASEYDVDANWRKL